MKDGAGIRLFTRTKQFFHSKQSKLFIKLIIPKNYHIEPSFTGKTNLSYNNNNVSITKI